MISDGEMQDFNSAITDAGFDPDDFSAVAVEDEPQAVEYAITGTVTVTRNSNGNAITYLAGHGSNWVFDFETCLKSGQFGRP